MILYEVNLSVESAIGDEFKSWLIAHIEEIVAIDGVIGARRYHVDDAPKEPPGRVKWCVHYFMRDRAAFENYIARHAPRLREDGLSRFGARFSATRRVMQLEGEALS